MAEYEFELLFEVRYDDSTDKETWSDEYIEALGEAGCTDATIGSGRVGVLAMRFSREAESATEAMSSAIQDVRRAIPTASLRGAAPDLVGVSEIALLLEQTPQNIRKKIVRGHWPSGAGGSTNVWHLATVLENLDEMRNLDAKQRRRLERLRHISRYAMLINQRSELLSLSANEEAEIKVLQWIGARRDSRAS